MRKSFRKSSGLALVVLFGLAGFIRTTSAAPLDQKAKITVCVYDHARLKGETLAQAEKEATRIFRQLGVEVEWLDLPTSEEEANGKTDSLEQLGPTGFVLKILPKSITRNLHIRDAALGFSIPCPEGGSACIASILYHRVEDLARRENVSFSQVLGLAIAHEIGHLLLRSNAHSATGVMQARWRSKEVQRASQGLLLFSPEQAERIRADVLNRVRQREDLSQSARR
jgi:hypothetical protein